MLPEYSKFPHERTQSLDSMSSGHSSGHDHVVTDPVNSGLSTVIAAQHPHKINTNPEAATGHGVTSAGSAYVKRRVVVKPHYDPLEQQEIPIYHQ